MDHRAAKSHMLALLHEGLSSDLTYHSLEHTLDVYASAITIGELEGITGKGMELLKTAAIFHDAGYLLGRSDHEMGSCRLVHEHLPGFGFQGDEVDAVCAMIMATKLPQRPTDLLSEILCDADLDYLGRRDFEPIGHLLFLELKLQGALKTEREWNMLQEEFLSQHAYFTQSSRSLREPEKLRHLEEIRKWLQRHP